MILSGYLNEKKNIQSMENANQYYTEQITYWKIQTHIHTINTNHYKDR